MADKQGPTHVVVDGSNLATEGRSMPSLAQLEEAVASYMDENPDVQVTVVVDATFAHRIDKSESARYEEGVENNELVAPPAGAVGRGDAFVLGIADKAGSIVLSNDSFQEFHGEYDWLFDEGRLVGGKPVPHVGWVWVERNPVRGPVSRKATRGSKDSKSSSRSGSRSRGGSRKRTVSKEASQPMPVPSAPPPGVEPKEPAQPISKERRQPSNADRKDVPKRGEPVNELMPFLDFVEQHPVGTAVSGVVDAYSSHGAYVTIGDVRGYLPLRMMADPPPRSAKKAVTMGDSLDLVVVSFAPARRSIDCALPAMAEQVLAELEATGGADDSDGAEERTDRSEQSSSGRRRGGRRRSERSSAGSDTGAAAAESAAETASTETKPATRKSTAKKTAAKQTAKKSATKQTAAKKAAAKKSATKQTAAKKAVAKKATATKKTATKKAAAKKSATKKAATKKTAAKKTAATTTATTKSAAKKAASKRSASKKTAAKKTAAKKTAAKKTAAKKTAAKKTAAKGS